MVYKLVTDLENIDLNQFFELMDKKEIDVCLDGEDIYLYQKYNKQLPIGMLMKKMKITNFFLKKITEKPSVDTNGFVYKWIYEKMSEDEVAAFEEAHQKELRQMMDNIQKAQEELRARKENQKEVVDGSIEADHLAQTGEGASKESASGRE